MSKPADVAAATPAEVRAWAVDKFPELGARGRIPADVTEAFNKAHRSKAFAGSPAVAAA